MSNLNPEHYQNGVPVTPTAEVAVAAGEVVNSASPAVTLGPAKAIVAVVGSALLGGLTALGFALQDNVIDAGEWVAVAIAVIVGSGIVGGATYLTRTTVTGNPTH